MVFESLAEKLQNTFKNLRSKGRLTEDDVNEAMREVKFALLEADVNYKVVKDFIKKVIQRAIGQDILESLTPGQHVIKIVNEELTELMGSTQSKVIYSPKPPTVILVVGLQGAGKTTFCGKLGNLLRKDNKKPLLVACDIYRPAAIKQLQVVGSQLDIPVFEMGTSNPVEIAKKSIEFAKINNHDLVIIDTAGRLHINDELMEELEQIKSNVRPQEILLVLDSMTGQDAVNVAEVFNGKLGIDGVILTKLDGDTRGGAALSVRAVIQKPIKFIGTGEKLKDIEEFHPDRMASRILGMGDVLSLIEKAQENFDEKAAYEMEKKIRMQTFSLDDFLAQMQQMKKLGPINQLMGMIPGMDSKMLKDVNVNEKDMLHIEAIIQSMTKKERQKPEIINANRKKRIANGSGTSVQEVNKLLKQFEGMKKMMKQFTDMTGKGKKKMPFKMPF